MSELPPTPRQRLRKALLDCGKRADAAEARVKVLEEALTALVNKVLEYERTNSLAPNPGRTKCWDEVAAAVAALAPKRARPALAKEEGGK